MSAFFSDPPSANNPYRIFVRCADPARGFGGTAFKRSYCLEYDSASVGGEPPEVPAYLSQKVPSPNSPIRQPISVNDLRGLLAHEMVHNWPLLGKAVDSDQSSKAYDWYNEGLLSFFTSSHGRITESVRTITGMKQSPDVSAGCDTGVSICSYPHRLHA